MTTTGVPTSITYLIGSGPMHVFAEMTSDEPFDAWGVLSLRAAISYQFDPSFDSSTAVDQGHDYWNLILAAPVGQTIPASILSNILITISPFDASFSDTLTIESAYNSITTYISAIPIVFTTSNTAPTVTLSPSAQDLIFTEGGSAVDVFKDVVVSTVETGQKIVEFHLSVTHADAGHDVLTVDGTAITLTAGASGTTSGHGWSYTVTIGQDGVAHLSFTSTGMYQNAFSALIDAISFSNASDDPATANSRTISLDYLKDDGDNTIGTGGDGDTDVTGASASIGVVGVNDAADVSLSNATTSLAENISTASHIKVADISISDVDGGNNVLSLSGADASLFEIVNGQLFIKAGAVLDYETNKDLDVTVNVDDTGVAGSPDDSVNFHLSLTDVAELTVITGTDAANTLVGTEDTDRIDGKAGNDTITANGGADTIIGGKGYDVMSGGSGADVFEFNTKLDSAYGGRAYLWQKTASDNAGHRDIITDFVHGEDKIDLSAIDANTHKALDQAFAFRGTGSAVPKPGQVYVRYFSTPHGDVTIVSADTDGNMTPDLQIELKGHITLTAADFIL